MKVLISYQHCDSHSKYDREFVGEGETLPEARAKATVKANLALRGIGLPTGFGWANRIHQGDNMLAVMYEQ